MKIYACAISVDNYKDGRFEVFPAAVSAINEQEAIGKAIDIAHKEKPLNSGYSSYQATVIEMPYKWIQEINNGNYN